MPSLTPDLLPFAVFLVLGITEFIMGLSWGMYAIAFPIAIPLAVAADPVGAVVAVCSAGVWGSPICFYSDASGCDNFQHATTQMPFGFLGAFFSAIALLVVGYM